MNTSKKQSEGRKAGGSGIPRLKSVLIALTLGLLLAPPVSCQQMIWQAFNDSGSKFYDEHDYERAEKSLLICRIFDAPREGSAPLLRYISSITQRADGAGAT